MLVRGRGLADLCKPGFQRARDSASAVSRGIACGANWVTGGTDYTPGLVSPTPDQLDYIFGTVTGGLGRELNNVYQTGELMARGKDVPEYNKPIIGRFYGDFEGDTAIASRYWALVREVSSKQNEFAGRKKGRRLRRRLLGGPPGIGLGQDHRAIAADVDQAEQGP